MNDNEKEVFERLTAVESSVRSLHKRVDRHDALIESIQKLTIATENLTLETKNLREDVNKVAEAVDEIEKKPAKHWESVIAAIIAAIGGGLGGAIISSIIGG